MFGRAERCQYCDDFPGSGKCGSCYGSGKNVHLNADRLDCEECHGSAICRHCNGQPSLGPPLSRRLRDRTMQILSKLFG